MRSEANFTEIGLDPFETFLRGNAIGMHATVMYRREALEESGGFDPALRACEDYDLYLRLSRRHPVASHRRCLAEYRMHDANMSRKNSLMLHWALLVLRRQRGDAERSDKLRSAYKAGLRNWKRMYLRRQLAAARRERTVAAIGGRVSAWKVGDAVMGIESGACNAELVVTHERQALPVPSNVAPSG